MESEEEENGSEDGADMVSGSELAKRDRMEVEEEIEYLSQAGARMDLGTELEEEAERMLEVESDMEEE